MDRPLPSAEDVEKLTLGSIFHDPKLFSQLADLSPDVYYHPTHRKAFIAMRNLYTRNEAINPITVFEEMKAQGSNGLTVVDLTYWSHGIPFFTSLDQYVYTLKDRALKRALIRKCGDVIEGAYTQDTGAEITAHAVSELQALYAEAESKQRPTVTLAEALEGNYERWDKMLRQEIICIETGLPDVDVHLTGGGFEKGMFHVIGARPGKGKTSLALDIAAHNAAKGKGVMFFTLELSRDVLVDRFISPLAGIPRWHITSKWIRDHDQQRLIETSEKVKVWPMRINHKARTVEEMRLACKEMAREMPIDLIVVDFLTKMHGGKGSKYESVSHNANGLAELAVEHNAAVICLAQLSRGITKRVSLDAETQGKPELSDFRDSGEIEELGRTVLGLWGEYTEGSYRPVKLSCLKQGEGALFDVDLAFNVDFMTFGGRTALSREI